MAAAGVGDSLPRADITHQSALAITKLCLESIGKRIEVDVRERPYWFLLSLIPFALSFWLYVREGRRDGAVFVRRRCWLYYLDENGERTFAYIGDPLSFFGMWLSYVLFLISLLKKLPIVQGLRNDIGYTPLYLALLELLVWIVKYKFPTRFYALCPIHGLRDVVPTRHMGGIQISCPACVHFENVGDEEEPSEDSLDHFEGPPDDDRGDAGREEEDPFEDSFDHFEGGPPDDDRGGAGGYEQDQFEDSMDHFEGESQLEGGGGGEEVELYVFD